MAAPSRRALRWLTVVLLVAVVASAVGAALMGAARHRREADERERRARAAGAGPRVRVARVAATEGARQVTLPGEVRAFWDTTLYAKVNGYVAELLVDVGDRVRSGQVLARIASPETDRQVDQARANLRVRRKLAARLRRLAPTGYVSRQDLDQANADLAVAEGELRRLETLQGYEVLRAPFDGLVTARFVDPGALLSASATGVPVVEVADPRRVRVLVYLGQDVAPYVRLGDPGTVTVDQQPDLAIRAAVRKSAGALDPRTRSMLVELWPEGPGKVPLVPGTFVHVAVRVEAPAVPEVPAEALSGRGDRQQVALVRDGRLHFVDVEPGLSDGRTLQVRRGVAPGDVVALSPPADLGEGAPVQAVEPRTVAGREPPVRPGPRTSEGTDTGK